MTRDAKLDICKWCSRATWCEMRQTPQGHLPQCFGCKAVNHMKWCFKFLGMTALQWQIDAARAIWGTLETETGLRRYRRAFISMAKKNGKSFWSGWAPLYHLEHDFGVDKQVLGLATTRQQATEVFDSAALLIRQNSTLSGRFEIIKSTRVIRHLPTGTQYRVLAAEGRKNDGVRSSLWICDELHRFHTQAEEDNRDALTRSTRGREEPIGIDITTAGDPTESVLWRNEYNYAKSVLDGTAQDARYFAMIHEADPEKLATDPEYWKSREARVAGNPSHEDLGGYIKDEELQADLAKAIQIPSEQRKYWRFTLNAQSENESKMFMQSDWKRSSAQPGPLIDRTCFVGVDLSSTTDFTAVVLVFPDGEYVDVVPYFFVPEDRVPAIARQLGPWGQDFQQWCRSGAIEMTPGNEVDYGAVEKKIEWACQNFQVQEIDYDRWNATQLMQQLIDKGYRCVPVQQGIPLSAAIKELQRLVLAGKLRHGGNPVLAWMAGCAKAKQDQNENMRLVKAIRTEEASRVDGIAALLTALSRLMVMPKTSYEVTVI